MMNSTESTRIRAIRVFQQGMTILGIAVVAVGTYYAALRQNHLWFDSRKLLDERSELSLDLGKQALDRHDYNEAERVWRMVLTEGSPKLRVNAFNRLADLSNRRGHFYQAEVYYTKALDTMMSFAISTPKEQGVCMNNLANVLLEEHRYTDAELMLDKCLSVKYATPSTSLSIYSSLNNLGTAYWHQHEYEKAERLFTKLIESEKQVDGDSKPIMMSIRNNLAAVYMSEGAFRKAESIYKDILKHPATDNPDKALCLANLGTLYAHEHEFSKAERYLQDALRLQNELLEPQSPRTAGIMHNLAGVYAASGRMSESEVYYRKALKIRTSTIGPKDSDTQSTKDLLEQVQRKRG